MTMMTIFPNSSPKIPKIYKCELCKIETRNKKDFNKHILTRKHCNNDVWLQNDTKKSPKSPKLLKTSKEFICGCGKEYKYRQGLYVHNKKCDGVPVDLKTLVMKLMVENHEMKNTIINENIKLQNHNLELQKQVLDVCKANNSNNTINSHNKTFNLQFFLNEQCKDAMNITDFINSVTLSLSDLENMASSGYVNGISSIIIKELRGLDITKRPVHCSDSKRETLYIKDEDKWEKEGSENTKMKKAIRTVEKKNISLISEWTNKHPKFTNSTSSENDEYLNILIETMGGKGDYEKNKNKIIKNIAKEVIIDK